MPSGMTPMIVAGWPLTRSDLAEHVRIAAVPVLPEVVADDDDRFGPGALVAGREVAAEERLLAEHAERVGGRATCRCTCSGHARSSLMFIVASRYAASPAKLRLAARQS